MLETFGPVIGDDQLAAQIADQPSHLAVLAVIVERDPMMRMEVHRCGPVVVVVVRRSVTEHR
jgi:methylglyoxal synthase